MIEYIAIGFAFAVVAWVGGLLTWITMRREQLTHRSLDLIMVLASKEKAVLSTSVTKARERGEGGKKNGTIEQKDPTNERNIDRANKLYDEVMERGTITSKEETFLSEHAV